MFYLDDGLVIAEHHTLQHYLAAFLSPAAVSAGLHLRPDKCSVWWPSAPPDTVRTAYPTQVSLHFSGGTPVLGAYVGGDEHVAEALRAHVESLAPIFRELDELADGQVTLTLLRSCMSVGKINYLLRTTPPPLSAPAAALYDDLITRSFRRRVGGALPAELLPELRLPVCSEAPTFGVGLTSASRTAPSAFLASVAGTAPTLARIFPDTPHEELVDSVHTRAAYAAWSELVAPGAAIPFPNVLGKVGYRQRQLMEKVHEYAAGDVPETYEHRSAHRAFLGLPGAKDWLACPPTPGTGTNIPDEDFRLWMKFHCGLTLFNDGTPCPRPACGEILDPLGDHLLHCAHRVAPHNAPRTWRHDSLVVALAATLRRARRNAIVEPRAADSRPRPDIRTERIGGGTDFLDVSVHHPLTGPVVPYTVKVPASVLRTAVSHKRSNYRHFIEAQGDGSTLFPIALTTLGGWEADAREYFREVGRSLATTTRVAHDFSTHLVFGRVSALLVALNCRALTEGLTPADGSSSA